MCNVYVQSVQMACLQFINVEYHVVHSSIVHTDATIIMFCRNVTCMPMWSIKAPIHHAKRCSCDFRSKYVLRCAPARSTLNRFGINSCLYFRLVANRIWDATLYHAQQRGRKEFIHTGSRHSNSHSTVIWFCYKKRSTKIDILLTNYTQVY